MNNDQPARLTLIKEVDDNDSGADAAPEDWTLTAMPQGITGQDPVSGNGNPESDDGVSDVSVFAGSYQLSEAGPAGFAPSAWECEGGTLAGAVVTVPNGGDVTCTITNTPIPPRLTLVKTVNDPDGIGDAVNTDWELTADGPVTITGPTETAAVTNAAVQVGTYDLTEDGPPGYTASNWVCTGASETTAASVTLELGDTATCTITNTPIPPRLTLVKTVNDPDGIGDAVNTDWELTADGPVTITGPTETAAVTNAAVQVGTYDLTEDGPPRLHRLQLGVHRSQRDHSRLRHPRTRRHRHLHHHQHTHPTAPDPGQDSERPRWDRRRGQHRLGTNRRRSRHHHGPNRNRSSDQRGGAGRHL